MSYTSLGGASGSQPTRSACEPLSLNFATFKVFFGEGTSQYYQEKKIQSFLDIVRTNAGDGESAIDRFAYDNGADGKALKGRVGIADLNFSKFFFPRFWIESVKPHGQECTVRLHRPNTSFNHWDNNQRILGMERASGVTLTSSERAWVKQNRRVPAKLQPWFSRAMATLNTFPLNRPDERVRPASMRTMQAWFGYEGRNQLGNYLRKLGNQVVFNTSDPYGSWLTEFISVWNTKQKATVKVVTQQGSDRDKLVGAVRVGGGIRRRDSVITSGGQLAPESSSNKALLIGAGAVVVAGIGYYLYTENR